MKAEGLLCQIYTHLLLKADGHLFPFSSSYHQSHSTTCHQHCITMSEALSSMLSPPILVRPVPAVLGIALSLQGLNVAFNPSGAMTIFGLDPAKHASGPLSPIMASRNITLGLTFFVLWYLDMNAAAGLTMILGSIAPAVDAYVSEKWGYKGSGKSHAIGAVVSAVLGSAVVYYADK